ncbi:MAG: hypothetical protein WC850_04065 [Candidatus Gracilibacteria bacterium]|jgi:hypothetical protein
MAGLNLVKVHLVATDFLKRVFALTVGTIDIFLFFSVVPEELLIIIDVVGTLIVVVAGILKERVFSEPVEEEEVVGVIISLVGGIFVISGSVVIGIIIVSGEIVRVLVESVLVVKDEPVSRSDGEMITGVLIIFKERAYTENVRNNQQKPTKKSDLLAK